MLKEWNDIFSTLPNVVNGVRHATISRSRSLSLSLCIVLCIKRFAETKFFRCKWCLVSKLFVFNLVVAIFSGTTFPYRSTCQLITLNWFTSLRSLRLFKMGSFTLFLSFIGTFGHSFRKKYARLCVCVSVCKLIKESCQHNFSCNLIEIFRLKTRKDCVDCRR